MASTRNILLADKVAMRIRSFARAGIMRVRHAPESIANLTAFFWACCKTLKWVHFKTTADILRTLFASLTWIVPVVLIIFIIIQNISQDVITIEPISVPKSFSDSGYSQEVASQRLRDALNVFVKSVGSSMQTPSLSLRSDLPDIVVPKLDLSVDSIVASFRRLFHFGSRRAISGEFVIGNKLVWLRLRLNGVEIYSSQKGVDPEAPDELFADAAATVIDVLQPYLTAVATYNNNKTQALDKAMDIISRFPAHDVNVEWAYLLKGNYFFDQDDLHEAELAYRKALSINGHNSNLHNNLGLTLRHMGRLDDAIKEFRRSIELDVHNAAAHVNLGDAVEDMHELDIGIMEFRRLVQENPFNAYMHVALAAALGGRDKFDSAISEYRKALALTPDNIDCRIGLAVVLRNRGDLEAAVLEYRSIIELDPTIPSVHNNLGSALFDQGKVDEAIDEYHRAIDLRPNYKIAVRNLEVAQRSRSAAP